MIVISIVMYIRVPPYLFHSMPIRTAIVGLGTVAEWHRQGIRRTPGTDLVAVADTDPDRVDQTSTKIKTAGYTDVETLLNEVQPDWVHVCTPAQTHCDIAVTCLRAGTHVLVEKPFVMNTNEFDRLTTVADECDRRVTAVHNQVYYRPLRRVHRRVQSGEFGAVHGVSVRWAEHIDPSDSDRGDWVLDLPGGEFGEGIVHPIYVGLRFAGYPVNNDGIGIHRINATDSATSYDGIAVSFQTVDDTTCTIHHHSNVPDQRRVDIAAEDAHITVDIASQSVTVQKKSFGPNSNFKHPLFRSSIKTMQDAIKSVGDATRQWIRERTSEATVHDTHTPVIRREAQAIRGQGSGPTPQSENRWTTQIFSRINKIE